MSYLFFRIQINGNTIGNRFETADEAMNHAKGLFVKDHSIKEADIYRHDEELVATIRNKDYENPKTEK